jgi:hypothetical protein
MLPTHRARVSPKHSVSPHARTCLSGGMCAIGSIIVCTYASSALSLPSLHALALADVGEIHAGRASSVAASNAVTLTDSITMHQPAYRDIQIQSPFSSVSRSRQSI